MSLCPSKRATSMIYDVFQQIKNLNFFFISWSKVKAWFTVMAQFVEELWVG